MKQVYINEEWVVQQYLKMEKAKSWKEMDSKQDLRVLTLERELLAESLGVTTDALHGIDDDESAEESGTHNLTQ